MFSKQPTNPFDKVTIISHDYDVEIFDPPMCCPTGLCGPAIDQELLDVTEMIQHLKNQGLKVERFQMTTHPARFAENQQVMGLIREKQMVALPITVVRGEIVASGYYPKLEDIQKFIHKEK